LLLLLLLSFQIIHVPCYDSLTYATGLDYLANPTKKKPNFELIVHVVDLNIHAGLNRGVILTISSKK
jgi:hypothetical protein